MFLEDMLPLPLGHLGLGHWDRLVIFPAVDSSNPHSFCWRLNVLVHDSVCGLGAAWNRGGSVTFSHPQDVLNTSRA